MFRIQTKLIIAFLGSTLVSVMIWDRGSRNGEPNLQDHHEHEETYELTDEERIFHRSKRAVMSINLQNVYKTFSNVERCCQIPKMLSDEALNNCFNGRGQRKGQKLQTWFSGIKQVYSAHLGNTDVKTVAKTGTKIKVQSASGSKSSTKSTSKTTKSVAKSRGKRAQDKISLDSVCATDCCFTYDNLLNDTALDLSSIEDQFVGRVENRWKPLVQEALYTCEEPAACATPSEVRMSNRYCSIKPTILQNCIRKQLILNCPAFADGKCSKSKMNGVRQMNVFSVDV